MKGELIFLKKEGQLYVNVRALYDIYSTTRVRPERALELLDELVDGKYVEAKEAIARAKNNQVAIKNEDRKI